MKELVHGAGLIFFMIVFLRSSLYPHNSISFNPPLPCQPPSMHPVSAAKLLPPHVHKQHLPQEGQIQHVVSAPSSSEQIPLW